MDMFKLLLVLVIAAVIWYFTSNTDFVNKGKTKTIQAVQKEKTIQQVDHARGIQQRTLEKVLDSNF